MDFQELNHAMENVSIRFTTDRRFALEHGMTLIEHLPEIFEAGLYSDDDLNEGDRVLLLTEEFNSVSDLTIGIILSYAIMRKDRQLIDFISEKFSSGHVPDFALKYCHDFYGPHAVATFELESIKVLKQIVEKMELDESFTSEEKTSLLADISEETLQIIEKLNVPHPAADLTLIEYRKEIASKIARKLLDKSK